MQALGPVIGYVSNERYLSVAGVHCEFIHARSGARYAVDSTATGAVCADIPPGEYQVALALEGYGAKTSTVALPLAEPHHFRILKDQLLGYVWPKYATGGEAGEFRVHSAEAYKLSLWRYGAEKVHVEKIGWLDEHGPRATVQVVPDGDYTQTGCQWNKEGFPNPQHKQFIQAPARTGLYYFHADAESGEFFSFPWIVAPGPDELKAPVALMMANINWNAYNNFGGRRCRTQPPQLPVALQERAR